MKGQTALHLCDCGGTGADGCTPVVGGVRAFSHAETLLGLALNTEAFTAEILDLAARLDHLVRAELDAAAWWSRSRIKAGWFARLAPVREAVRAVKPIGRAATTGREFVAIRNAIADGLRQVAAVESLVSQTPISRPQLAQGVHS